MNLFKLTGPGSEDIGEQIKRYAPPYSVFCAIEADADDDRLQIATSVIEWFAASRDLGIVVKQAQGYQLGSAEKHRTTKYRLFYFVTRT